MQQHALDHQKPHPDDLHRATELFKAFSDPTRVQLVLLLAQAERNVTQLVDALKQPQSTVSRHLGILRAAQLVKTRRDNNNVYYHLADAHIARLVSEAFSHAQHERLALPDHPAEQLIEGGIH